MRMSKRPRLTIIAALTCLLLLGHLGYADDTCVFQGAIGNGPFSSFTAPVVPVAGTLSQSRIYLAFFNPSDENFWEGNVVKLGLSTDQEIIDAEGNPATEANGAIKTTAVPFWATKNWADPTKSNYVLNSSRHIYTYMGIQSDLTAADNAFSASNTLLTAAVLGNPSHLPEEIINYIRGQDVFDEDGDGDHGENRVFITGDVLHSEPLPIYYNESLTVVYFGSNDGMLHAVKDSSLDPPANDDGSELWAFIPPDQLDRLKDIIEGSGHQYYVDASPRAYIRDVNGNGIIETDVDSDGDGDVDEADRDRVVIVCGERKGGTSYFALDVTDPQNPFFLWRISQSNDAGSGTLQLEGVSGTFQAGETLTGENGGSAFVSGLMEEDLIYYQGQTGSFQIGETVTGDASGATATVLSIHQYAPLDAAPDVVIPELGETWSEPEFGLVKTSDSDTDLGTPVFFIGGGFSANNSAGKAVLAVDVFTGAVVKKFSMLSGMNYSFPSALAVLDTNGNGLVDKVYVGDLGSQMWRFGRFTDADGALLGFPETNENINEWTGQIFFLSDAAHQRKFFYPPSVTLENGYDLVFMGTGDREDPCNPVSSDRIYSVKDIHTAVTWQEADLVDVTAPDATLPDLAVNQGWFIRLAEGQKVLSEGVVFSGAYYVSTYAPSQDQGQLGVATLYTFKYKTAEAFSGSSRSVVVGGSIPSKPVVAITPTRQKLFVSVGKTNPAPGVDNVGAGILTLNPPNPPSNLFFLWWIAF